MFYKHVKNLVERSKLISSKSLAFKGNRNKFVADFPSTYSDLEVKVSFGQGNWAEITWIGFLFEGQEIQRGIYPVFLYYRSLDILILAYGVSATYPPSDHWKLLSPTTIGDYFNDNGIKGSKKYNNSFVFKVYKGKINKLIDTDLDELIKEYKELFPAIKSVSSVSPKTIDVKPAKPVMSMHSLIKKTIKTIKDSGLIYKDQFVSRFVISLMTKPFVILSGLSGSGKTQLAIAFAKAMSANVEKQVCIVPVGADWTNREPLLGYPNSLRSNEYVLPESGALQLLLRAAKDPDNPYFLILDEMNLSYVERYFADFLSALESHDMIPLWEGESSDIPKRVALPGNFFIIGTINVDETTYMFSPKVLDRANVIEFKIDPSEMDDFIEKHPNPDISKIQSTLVSEAKTFVELSTNSIKSDFGSSKDVLLDSFNQLKQVNAEFGYRSASEIGRFVSLAQKIGGMSADEATDAAMVQKLLPKLHGSRKKLEPVLKALWSMCETGSELDMSLNADSAPSESKYILTADKLLRMYKGAVNNSFTSFAEA